jgi:hypothetical protein
MHRGGDIHRPHLEAGRSRVAKDDNKSGASSLPSRRASRRLRIRSTAGTEKTYPRPPNSNYFVVCLASLRAPSIAAFERSETRPPTMRAAVERWEAPGPFARARAPEQVSQACSASSARGRAARPALGASRTRLPGASQRSIPLFEGNGKQGYGHPGRPKNQGAGQRSVG